MRQEYASFSSGLDATLKSFGVRVLKTPVRAPKANAFCERLIGTIRGECLDFLIPLGEGHLKRILREWVGHYNRGRPHSSLGPGIPEPHQAKVPASVHRHKLPAGCRVTSTLVSVGCTMNIAWRRKPHDAGLNFCGPQLRRRTTFIAATALRLAVRKRRHIRREFPRKELAQQILHRAARRHDQPIAKSQACSPVARRSVKI